MRCKCCLLFWQLAVGTCTDPLGAVAGRSDDTLQPGLELALGGEDGSGVAPSMAPRSVINRIGRRPVLCFIVVQIDRIFSGNLDYFC